MTRVIIIGHGYTSRLAVIRSVAQIGCDITVIVMTGNKRYCKKLNPRKPIDCYSKYVNRYLFCHIKDEEGLIELLLSQCVDSQQKVVIIPDNDFSAAVIDKNQKRLQEHFLFPNIHHMPGAVVRWMDKVRQKTLACEIGLNVTSFCVINVKDQHYDIPSGITYPCFTKPLATIVGGKRILKQCNNEMELRTILDFAATLGDMQVLVEDFKIIDTEYAVLGFSDGKNVVIPGIIQILNLAHGGHFGVASRGKVMPIIGFEDIVLKFKEYINQIGFVGLFDIDFYLSDGTFYFGELNLRVGGSLYAVTKMGVNLPGMLVKSLYGEKIDGMSKEISSTATYVNERMLLDDWTFRYISTKEYKGIMNSAKISFVDDEDDKSPFRHYQRVYWKRKIRRFIKRIIPNIII